MMIARYTASFKCYLLSCLVNRNFVRSEITQLIQPRTKLRAFSIYQICPSAPAVSRAECIDLKDFLNASSSISREMARINFRMRQFGNTFRTKP